MNDWTYDEKKATAREHIRCFSPKRVWANREKAALLAESASMVCDFLKDADADTVMDVLEVMATNRVPHFRFGADPETKGELAMEWDAWYNAGRELLRRTELKDVSAKEVLAAKEIYLSLHDKFKRRKTRNIGSLADFDGAEGL